MSTTAPERDAPRLDMSENIALRIIALDDIYIDKYQRQLDERWLRAREGKVDVAMLGTLVLSDRSRDGKQYSCIDGQHRHELLSRHGVDEWAAVVFTGLSVEDEADLFIRFQTERRNIRPIDRFRAKIVAGDATALGVQRIVQEAGYLLGENEGSGSIKAVRAVEKIYDENPAHLKLVLRLIRTTWGDLPFAQNERMIKGLHGFVRDEPALDEARFVDRLGRVTPSEIGSRADSLKSGRALTSGLPSFWREVIQDVYNQRPKRS